MFLRALFAQIKIQMRCGLPLRDNFAANGRCGVRVMPLQPGAQLKNRRNLEITPTDKLAPRAYFTLARDVDGTRPGALL